MILIGAENISLGYEGKTVAENLTFEVREGDYLYILGENGSGKTTLMKAILKLQNCRMEGEITFGEGISRRDIGYLPQQTAFQRDFPASAKEIVMSGALAHEGFSPFHSAKSRKKADMYMEKLGISDLKNKCYGELSGGQKQKVLLARAFMAAKKALLLDEPTNGLDERSAKEMYDHLETANKEGMTIIMISHDLPSAVKYASHVLHIGENGFFGTKEEYVKGFLGGRVSEND